MYEMKPIVQHAELHTYRHTYWHAYIICIHTYRHASRTYLFLYVYIYIKIYLNLEYTCIEQCIYVSSLAQYVRLSSPMFSGCFSSKERCYCSCYLQKQGLWSLASQLGLPWNYSCHSLMKKQRTIRITTTGEWPWTSMRVKRHLSQTCMIELIEPSTSQSP